MKEDRVSEALHDAMNGVRLSPDLRAKTLYAMRGSEERKPKMKRKFSAALVFALAAVLAVAVALAVANHAGLLDYMNASSNAQIPYDAASYIKQSAQSGEGNTFSLNVREEFYDGRTLRLTTDITAKAPKTLLYGLDFRPEDSWQDLITLTYDGVDTSDERSILDVYRENGYEQMMRVQMNALSQAEDDFAGTTQEVVLNDDGTLTFFYVKEFETDEPTRAIKLSASAKKVTEKDGKTESGEEETVEIAFTVEKENDDGETTVSAEPMEYESIGVRVDKVTMTAGPMEINYTVEYTVVDAEKFKRTDDGLWFEFIDPNSTETEPYAQRLKDGFSRTGEVTPMDDTHYRQTGTLSLDEKAERYTLRAYECWEKRRFDTHEIRMKKAE